MGRHPIPFSADALEAWTTLQARGGRKTLPRILRRRDLKQLFPVMYRFDALRREGLVPGSQMVPGGVWRVDRDVFIEWLKTQLPPEAQATEDDDSEAVLVGADDLREDVAEFSEPSRHR